MKNKFFEEEIHIEKILFEATSYGLRKEVETHANEILTIHPDMNKIEAYQLSYNFILYQE